MCWFDFIFSVAGLSPGDNIYSAFIDFEFSSSRPKELFPFGSVVRHFPGDFVEGVVGWEGDANFGIIDESADAYFAIDGGWRIVREKRMTDAIVGKEHGARGGSAPGGSIACTLAGAPKGRDGVTAEFGGSAVRGLDVVFNLLKDF